MKNKRLMGIIGLIAAAVIGTAIYSATAGKDNKAATSNEKAKVGVLQLVSHPSLDLIYKGIQDGLAEEGYDKDKVDIDFLNAEGDQNKVATMIRSIFLTSSFSISHSHIHAANNGINTIRKYRIPPSPAATERNTPPHKTYVRYWLFINYSIKTSNN